MENIDKLSTGNINLREFKIERAIRIKYGAEEVIFFDGENMASYNIDSIASFVATCNSMRHKDECWRVSDLNALVLINEIFYFIMNLYHKRYPKIWINAEYNLTNKLSQEELEQSLTFFNDHFSASHIMGNGGGDRSIESSQFDMGMNSHVILEELVVVYLNNKNKASAHFSTIFDHKILEEASSYITIINALKDFFLDQNGFGPQNISLLGMLHEPIDLYPTSFYDQLNYMYHHWGYLLGENLSTKILHGLDLIKEEYKYGSDDYATIRMVAPDYRADNENTAEAFSIDQNWMPRVVMAAKNSLVWLDQLSKKYGYEISSLGDIPDRELEMLSGYGFNALWLIGLWQRSNASKKIKQLMGNKDAEASAYSLDSNEISTKLGGWRSLEQLRVKATRYGIRLASDMVPNHTGIDSQWVREQPNFFLQLKEKPFRQYSFNGENLSAHDDIGIYLEDHYYTKEDASVVFKRVDFRTGDSCYIYHGNDGTATPWNDTAQIDFLNAEAREAVIQEIMHIAQSFPIIRFDAAMVLAKEHIHRLWYPKAGEGGDIASRSQFSLTDDAFNDRIPKEFWRELVDRITTELPNTLLLAEAFWMLEGYFVRTLGMHRVYNSAFMNMLMSEENSEYRKTIKNTQEFDSGILKRFVNFMSNPDEKTAIEQFGDGDKYFGVCAMMCSMPGLPMIAHGQIEGFSEKYGMEYAKACYDEIANEVLLQRHKKEIFPLLSYRYLFADCEQFRLYDFLDSSGTINENVYAYSNSHDHEKTIFVFNNCGHEAQGYIQQSSCYRVKNSDGGYLAQESLAKSLSLHDDGRYYLLLDEQLTGLSYVRSSSSLYREGLYFKLKGYEHQLFWHLEELYDENGYIAELAEELSGNAVFNIKHQLTIKRLYPIHHAIPMLFDPYHNLIREIWIGSYRLTMEPWPIEKRIKDFILQINFLDYETLDRVIVEQELLDKTRYLCGLISFTSNTARSILSKNYSYLPFLASWVVSSTLIHAKTGSDSRWLFDDLLFTETLSSLWHQCSWGDYHSFSDIIQWLSSPCLLKIPRSLGEQEAYFNKLLNSEQLASICNFNSFGGCEWFQQEKTEQLFELFLLTLYSMATTNTETAFIDEFTIFIHEKISKAQYRVDSLRSTGHDS